MSYAISIGKFGSLPVLHIQYGHRDRGGNALPWERGKYGGALVRHKGKVKESDEVREQVRKRR